MARKIPVPQRAGGPKTTQSGWKALRARSCRGPSPRRVPARRSPRQRCPVECSPRRSRIPHRRAGPRTSPVWRRAGPASGRGHSRNCTG
ncbi:hypothetical protein DFK10_07585 [Salibaculum griseiflavum]|uniref:Uncharacterized protein n=1 Tax=Salibaculum griseiflavum TaxID=1914409 RepID=A0A2V1P613_9RHOB|nr:hypothetical protein DFK10_07585 [Salibaculum griseiflavum]